MSENGKPKTARYCVVCKCGDLNCLVHWFENEYDALGHAYDRRDWPQTVYEDGKVIYENEAMRDGSN